MGQPGGARQERRRHLGRLVAVVALASCASAPGEPTGTISQASTTVCGAPTNGAVQGVDVSHWQGAFDWNAAKARGISFGYASIGDGTGFVDTTFGTNWANIKAAGLLRGAYQYFEPGQDATAQANLMIGAVGKLGAGDLPSMVDVETTGGQSGATIASRVRTWLGVVEAGTGRAPLVYTGPSFWDSSVGDTTFGATPLWIADYGPPCPAVPNGWSSWQFWQYSSSNGTLDLDVFNGSLAQLSGLAGPACTSACIAAPRVGIAPSATGEGYWIVDAAGDVLPDGNASFFGDLHGQALSKPVVAVVATSAGQGYWLAAADGGVFSFGNAGFFGSAGGTALNRPVVGMAATPGGSGYWLVASDGGVFNYGSAGFYGSAGGMTLNAPVVGMASKARGKGYWLVESDGGIFTYGDAEFYGSAGGMTLSRPVVGMAATATGKGYWLVASDGGIFSYGDAAFHGSAGAMALNAPVVGMAATTAGGGYWLLGSDGGLFSFGDATYLGNGVGATCAGGVPQSCVVAASGCGALSPLPACASGQACGHGTCQPTCTDACTAGQSQCSGALLELCGHYGGAPCNTWSTPTACPSGETCMAGVCGSAACMDDCEPGATACVAGDLASCNATKGGGCHTWGAPTACQAGQTCQTGGCSGQTVVASDAGTDAADGGVVLESGDAGVGRVEGGAARADGGVTLPGDGGEGGVGPAGGCSCRASGREPGSLRALVVVLAVVLVLRRREPAALARHSDGGRTVGVRVRVRGRGRVRLGVGNLPSRRVSDAGARSIPMGNVSVESNGRGGRKSVDAEINMIPMIDLLMVTISFLLITAVWSHSARLSADAQVPGRPEVMFPPPAAERQLHIDMRSADKFVLTWKQAGATLTTTEIPRREVVSLNRGARVVRYPELAARVASEWASAGAHRDEGDGAIDRAVLHTGNETSYATVVGAMDAAYQVERPLRAGTKVARVPAFRVSLAVD